MRSTDRLPEASGGARVECKGGTTVIEIELDSMKPASLFGGDYNTYVLWVVPPGGRAQNLGEILLDGSKAVVQATTPASVFAILISAEPHYLVGTPSAFLVLENSPGTAARSIDQPLVQGEYNFARSTLEGVRSAKGKVHSEVRQAFTAVRLAQRAGAADLAAEEFQQARRALDQTLAMWRECRDRTELAAQARATIKFAVAAQRLAHAALK
jgi:alkylation response protein AidB-like acyl-CoA dehydrogenase